MPQHLAQNGPVASPHDEDALRRRVGAEWNVGHHLGVAKLVPLRELESPVQHQRPAVLRRVHDEDVLILCALPVENVRHLQREAKPFAALLRQPQLIEALFTCYGRSIILHDRYVLEMAEACGDRTHQRRRKPPLTGFEARARHQTNLTSVRYYTCLPRKSPQTSLILALISPRGMASHL